MKSTPRTTFAASAKTAAAGLCLAALFTLLFGKPCAAQEEKSGKSGGNTVQAGSVDLELESETLDPYSSSQQQSIDYLKSLGTILDSGSVQAIEPPNESVLHYFTGAYLFCSIKMGTCPSLLDALLEVDLMNARHAHRSACPVLKKFWKRHIEDDFEKRHKYSIQTGHIAMVNEFNQKRRPGYVKCENTVGELLVAGEKDGEFFRARYAANSPVRQSLKSANDLLKQIQEKKINVFQQTGAQ